MRKFQIVLLGLLALVFAMGLSAALWIQWFSPGSDLPTSMSAPSSGQEIRFYQEVDEDQWMGIAFLPGDSAHAINTELTLHKGMWTPVMPKTLTKVKAITLNGKAESGRWMTLEADLDQFGVDFGAEPEPESGWWLEAKVRTYDIDEVGQHHLNHYQVQVIRIYPTSEK